MTMPDAYRLEGNALRVLLAGLGCRELYGLAPGEPVSEADGMACLANLVRAGVVQNDGSRLLIEEPLRGWLYGMAWAEWVLRVQTPGSPWPEGCLYLMPEAGEAVCCMEPATGRQLRLTATPVGQVWEHLCAICPTLLLPDAPPGASPEPAPELLTGEQFRLQLYRSGEGLQRQCVACWGSGCYILAENGVAVPFSAGAVQKMIEEWWMVAL